jgi:hypothetical protein
MILLGGVRMAEGSKPVVNAKLASDSRGSYLLVSTTPATLSILAGRRPAAMKPASS